MAYGVSWIVYLDTCSQVPGVQPQTVEEYVDYATRPVLNCAGGV